MFTSWFISFQKEQEAFKCFFQKKFNRNQTNKKLNDEFYYVRSNLLEISSPGEQSWSFDLSSRETTQRVADRIVEVTFAQ